MSGASNEPAAAAQADVIRFLRSMEAWPGQPARVDVVETHGALVFLAGADVMKIKRAVWLPYLDFSALDARRRYCEREVEINRPHAPEIYLGVVPITREADGRLAVSGAGPAVEWAVHMRRFAESDLLSRVVARQALTPQLAAQLADVVARYHATAPVAEPAANGLEQVATSIAAALRESGVPRIVQAAADLDRKVQAALAATRGIRAERAAAGLVRRCHGDLHLNNIVLWRGQPVAFDAIEFNEALATIDTLYDLAFLLMDLERCGARTAANAILGRYLWLTGAEIDVRGLAALPLYLGLRAGVRAMVALDRARTVGLDHGHIDHIADTLELAQRCLAPPPPRLVAVGGLSGSGKTLLASAVAPLFGPVPGALHLRSDLERKRLAGVGELERLPASSYTPDAARAVYARLARRAGLALQAGHSVVVDAVFAKQEERQAIEAVARDCGAAFEGVWLDAPSPVLKSRVARRQNDASDATAEVVDFQTELSLGDVAWRRIDASAEPATVLAEALRSLGLAQQTPGA